MARILVTWFSVSGHTQALADAVAEGVRSVDGTECLCKAVGEVSNDDLLAVDGLIVGSPTYFGQMAAEVKKLFDDTVHIYGKLDRKVGAAFTTSGGGGCGHELTNMSILIAMLVAGMVVVGTTEGPHFGPFAVGKPGEKDLSRASKFGARVARLTQQLWG